MKMPMVHLKIVILISFFSFFVSNKCEICRVLIINGIKWDINAKMCSKVNLLHAPTVLKTYDVLYLYVCATTQCLCIKIMNGDFGQIVDI